MNEIAEMTDIQALRDYYKSDFAAQQVLDYFSTRLKGSREMPVRVLAKRADLSETEARRVLKTFEEMEFGNFIVGRRGQESRMQWGVDILSLAQVARGETETVEEFAGSDDWEDEADLGGSELILHQFALRPDLKIEFRLPKDLTEREAQRLSTYIESLPFGE